MKPLTRFCLVLFTIVSLFLLSFNLSSCDEELMDSMNNDCTGCTSSAPWSKPGSGNCYATQADCEAAEGSGCVLCY